MPKPAELTLLGKKSAGLLSKPHSGDNFIGKGVSYTRHSMERRPLVTITRPLSAHTHKTCDNKNGTGLMTDSAIFLGVKSALR